MALDGTLAAEPLLDEWQEAVVARPEPALSPTTPPQDPRGGGCIDCGAPADGTADRAIEANKLLFDELTGASYHGYYFLLVLMRDPVAQEAARVLVERLRAAKCPGIDPVADELAPADG